MMSIIKLIKKHQKISLVVSILFLMFSLILAIGVYFGAKYWYPPVTAYPLHEVGRNAVIVTSEGEIEIELVGPKEAVAQFTNFSRMGFYNQTHIHRIVKDLMIEMGDPLTKNTLERQFWGQGGSRGIFKNQTTFNDSFDEGIVAMSGSKWGTYGSQFFITTKKTAWLKGKHTIIGRVIKGLEVVKKIENIETNALAMPIKDIQITEVRVNAVN